jgi:hypothetical protein
MPEKPLPLDQPLPDTCITDDALFRGSDAAMSGDSGLAAFRFSFPHLARQTPDLQFYRLIQVLNTPLLCLDSRDLGRADFAYWRGTRPAVQMRANYLYMWFFRDQNDQDLITAEYGFDGSFTLRSERKTTPELRGFYEELCREVNSR